MSNRKCRKSMRKILYHYGNKSYVRRRMRVLRRKRGRLYG